MARKQQQEDAASTRSSRSASQRNSYYATTTTTTTTAAQHHDNDDQSTSQSTNSSSFRLNRMNNNNSSRSKKMFQKSNNNGSNDNSKKKMRLPPKLHRYNSCPVGSPKDKENRGRNATAGTREMSSTSKLIDENNYDNAVNNSQNVNSSVWMDWIETCGADIFGCDENCGRRHVFDTLDGSVGQLSFYDTSPSSHESKAPSALHAVDYASLHDEFLEALLYEQAQLQEQQTHTTDTQKHQLDNDRSATDQEDSATISSTQDSDTAMLLMDSERSVPPQLLESSGSSERETNADSSLSSAPPTDNHLDETIHRKRRRTIRLHRRSNTEQALMADTSTNDNTNTDKSHTVSLAELSKTHFPHPSTFMHPRCRMQKDKGKGDAIGSSICAKGRDECLEKLRAKMRLITEHACADNKNTTSTKKKKSKTATATMKRRKARVSEHYDNFLETRSVIELRMGFLSMQYGVLLRWDTGRTGKITLVVLRKMCHDSFYPSVSVVMSPLQPQQASKRNIQPLPQHPHNNKNNNSINKNLLVVGDKNAILARPDGTEVTLLEPPYRVPRPEKWDELDPSATLTVAVLYAVGLERDSTWTVQLKHENSTENILLAHDDSRHTFLPKLGHPLQKNIALPTRVVTSNTLGEMEVKLFQHRYNNTVTDTGTTKKERRLVKSVAVPLHTLEAQKSSSTTPITPKILQIPVTNNGWLHVAAALQSDYIHWLEREMDVRRRDEAAAVAASSACLTSCGGDLATTTTTRACAPSPKEVEQLQEKEDPWEWICSVC